MRTRVRASVVVEVEVSGESTWGGDCPMEQVHKQALDDFARTMNLLRRSGTVDGIVHPAFPIRVISEPKVQMIIMNEDAPKG